jgi:hypothetical protein
LCRNFRFLRFPTRRTESAVTTSIHILPSAWDSHKLHRIF